MSIAVDPAVYERILELYDGLEIASRTRADSSDHDVILHLTLRAADDLCKMVKPPTTRRRAGSWLRRRFRFERIGRRLAAADREKFAEVLELVRVVVETEEQMRGAREGLN